MIKNQKINYELLLITLFAFALRLINLGKLNLWLDEGYSVSYVHRGLSFIFRESFTAEPNPPLYSLLLTFWIKIFGESEFSVRLPSVCFGALSISLVYLIGKKYVSRRIGILAAIMIIGNPFYLTYSQEARVYSFFSFLCLCSVYCFPVSFKWEEKRKYLLVTLLVPWAHAYGVFLLLAQNLYVLTSFVFKKCEKEFFKNWIKLQVLILGVTSIWYVPFLLNKEKHMKRFLWIKPFPLQELVDLLRSYIGERLFVFEVLISMSLVTAVYVLIKKKDSKNKGQLFLCSWLFFTIAIPVVVGEFWQPFLMEKYTIAASMVFVIVLLAPMDFFLKKSKVIFLIFLLLAALFNLRETQIYYKTARKQEWVKVIKTIVSNDQKKISIAIEGYYQGSPLEYYIRRMDLEKKIDIHYLNDFNDLKMLIKDKNTVWFIHAGNLTLGEFTLSHHFAEESFSHTNDLLQLVKLKQWPHAEK